MKFIIALALILGLSACGSNTKETTTTAPAEYDVNDGVISNSEFKLIMDDFDTHDEIQAPWTHENLQEIASTECSIMTHLHNMDELQNQIAEVMPDGVTPYEIGYVTGSATGAACYDELLRIQNG